MSPENCLGVFERVVPDEQGRVRYHYVLVDFLCRAGSWEPSRGDDAQEAQWFLQEELAGLELAAETEEVIRKGLRRSRVGVVVSPWQACMDPDRTPRLAEGSTPDPPIGGQRVFEPTSIRRLVIRTSPRICVHSETMLPTTCPTGCSGSWP